MSLKPKLKKGETTLGSWITIGDPSIAEIMACAGFDWLVVDMEHSAIGLNEAQRLIRVIELAGCVPLVRVGNNDPNLIKRVMDAGAHGVIVPMVNTREEAVRAVEAVRYPPLGKRGVGLARAQGYGFGFEQYKKWVNNESVVIVQTEHIDGVKNLEEILGVDGVDGFIVGPYDLSGSLGRPGDFAHAKMKKALERVEKISKKSGKAAGIHVIQPDPQEAEKRIKEGYNFVAFSLDTLFLGTCCREGVRGIKKAGRKK